MFWSSSPCGVDSGGLGESDGDDDEDISDAGGFKAIQILLTQHAEKLTCAATKRYV
jgi:hypothetical protein